MFLSGSAVLGGCQSATGPDYRGEPLFTLSGEMRTAGAAPTLPIRLAVAWYPDDNSVGGPQAIVFQDVAYQGGFPLLYTFAFYGPPPEAALAAAKLSGDTFRVAWGVLLAYEDLNGNGQLDLIPTNGRPIDHILGTSLGDLFNGQVAAQTVHVAYVDGQVPPSLAGFVPGYNLATSGQRVLLADGGLLADSGVVLELQPGDGPNELDLFACPDFLSGAYLASPNEANVSNFDLPCQVPPSGGVRVGGTVTLADGVPTAAIRVTDGTRPLVDASVTLNGSALTYLPADGLFEGTGGGFFSDGGADVLAVQAPGGDGGRLQLTLPKPADFQLQHPSPGLTQQFLQGGPLTALWTSSAGTTEGPGAALYEVSLISTLPPYGPDLQTTVDAGSGSSQQVELLAPAVDGPEWLYVDGVSRPNPTFWPGGSIVYASTYRSAYIDLYPADAGLTGGGQLVVTYDLASPSDQSQQVFVQPLQAASPLMGGAVTCGGVPLRYDPLRAAFVNVDGGLLQVGQQNLVQINEPGLPPFTVAVPVPGPFSLRTPLTSVDAGQRLDLSWTAADLAAAYNVLIYSYSDDGGVGAQLLGRTVAADAGSALTIVVPNQPGPAVLFLVALGAEDNRHFAGAVQDLLLFSIR